jgi:DNA-binding transcriptional LysR family regulator
MELMQLEMFVAVVEEGSVRRAAERVYRTQPAVSIALGKLKEEFGMNLLDDTRRRDRNLTEAGEVLYKYATRILGMRNEVLSVLRGERPGCTGRVCVGVDGAEDLTWMLQLAPKFIRQYPGIEVATHRDIPDRLIRNLRDQKIDLALLSANPSDKSPASDLVATPMRRSGCNRSLCVIQRRAHQSSALKAFSAMLISNSIAIPGAHCGA